MKGVICLNDEYCSLSTADTHHVSVVKVDMQDTMLQLMTAAKPLRVKTVDLIVDISGETLSHKIIPDINSRMQRLWRKNQVRINTKKLYLCEHKITVLDFLGEKKRQFIASGYVNEQLIKAALLTLLELGVVVKNIINLSQLMAYNLASRKMRWELLVTQKSNNSYRVVCIKADQILLSRELVLMPKNSSDSCVEIENECKIIRQHLITKNLLQNSDMRQAKIFLSSLKGPEEKKWMLLEACNISNLGGKHYNDNSVGYFDLWLELYFQTELEKKPRTHPLHRLCYFLRKSRGMINCLLIMVMLTAGLLYSKNHYAEKIYVLNIDRLQVLSKQAQENIQYLHDKNNALEKSHAVLLPAIRFSDSLLANEPVSPDLIINEIAQIIGHYPGLYVDSMYWESLGKVLNSSSINQSLSAENIAIKGGLTGKVSTGVGRSDPMQPLMDIINRSGVYQINQYDWQYTNNGDIEFNLDISRRVNIE